MTSALLEYERLSVSLGGNPVLSDVSLSLRRGEILCVVGESGSGKSTLLNAALHLLGPTGLVTGGSVRFCGEDVYHMAEGQLRDLRGPGVGMIHQDCLASFCPIRRIGDQIHEALAAHGSTSRAASLRLAGDMLARLNFPDPQRVLSSYPFELSGGMGQRVGIALCLLMSPQAVLADEPTSALDVVSQKRVVDELLRVREDFGLGMVVVTHNMGVARAMADRVLVLKDGRVVECGRAPEVLDRPRTAYTRALLDAAPRLRRGIERGC